MRYEDWIGQDVIVYCQQQDDIYSGTIEGWDRAARRLLLGPRPMAIPIDDIIRIQPGSRGRKNARRAIKSKTDKASAHSVGYVMKNHVQFDNAIYFKSPVTIWKGDKLLYFRTVIHVHTDQEVVLASGETLDKTNHVFVVRSIRG
ncbi:hypothetical protein J2Z69_000286 [Paenibacillus shirakamiensis]|uniref:Uncharacterized protein n=1 Tax=Paenibacillus shirakamiensis TaxID=1265935 RepID=A0ABS4JC28_9BACL|nr:hypothetical protein [Paenibacillus shirakamiensis]MBP1999267.1 hypothetical protein [Paenibacillus shirakamiensis]